MTWKILSQFEAAFLAAKHTNFTFLTHVYNIFTPMKEQDVAPPRIVHAPIHCLLKPHTGCGYAGETRPLGWGMLLQPVINQTPVAGGIIVPCLALRVARLISPGETRVSINITKHNAGWTSETARGSSVCAAAGWRKKQGSVLVTEYCHLETTNLLII